MAMNEEELLQRIEALEETVTRIGMATQGAKKRSFASRRQLTVMYGLQRALCVETVDPWKENRVRFYHPLIHKPDTRVLQLPFAKPVSAMGGFDDCGLNWVPPAGSTLIIMYEAGNRASPFYLGTTWHKNRGPGGSDLGYPDIREWEAVYKGHRKGYLTGADDESQSYVQWNTENYNGPDLEQYTKFNRNVDEQKRITYPHIYGFKTPEKHMIKMVDGNAKCNRRWKRMEIMSGCGNYMIFKDDHLHDSGQWANSEGNGYRCRSSEEQDVSLCSKHKNDDAPNDPDSGYGPYFTDLHGEPLEKQAECEGKVSSRNIVGGHPSTPGYPPTPPTKYYRSNKGKNPYFKHANECRPICGPGTPQNNKLDLPQSGIQILSISGHTWVMDDSVEEPKGKPVWERSLEKFDFGCNDKYVGMMYLKSATGHSLVLSDVEEQSQLRGKQNFVELKSASGNRLHMNDETLGAPGCPGAPPNYAGPNRGIWLESTSEHLISMNDYMNKQCGPCRAEGGSPKNDSTKAVMIMRSGYGHELRYEDHPKSQRETQKQWLQLTNPQCARAPNDAGCNKTRGPHFLKFVAAPEGKKGLIVLRAGGHHVRTTYDRDIVLVGTPSNPSDKFTYVSRKYIDCAEDIHFRYSGKQHIFFAEDKILLMAGRDCPPSPAGPPILEPDGDIVFPGDQGQDCCGPCLYSVIVSKCPVICPLTGILHWTEKAMSERVFASAMRTPCGSNCGGKGGPECGQKIRFNLEGPPPTEVQVPPNGSNVDPGAGMLTGGAGAFAGFPKIT